jgi:hypothetical protein
MTSKLREKHEKEANLLQPLRVAAQQPGDAQHSQLLRYNSQK